MIKTSQAFSARVSDFFNTAYAGDSEKTVASTLLLAALKVGKSLGLSTDEMVHVAQSIPPDSPPEDERLVGAALVATVAAGNLLAVDVGPAGEKFLQESWDATRGNVDHYPNVTVRTGDYE